MPFHPISGTDDPERLEGTNHRDLITAGAGADTVWGGGGGDRMYGERGDDRLSGSYGSDTLYGGTGDDSLQSSDYDTGDTGHLYGGAGNDSLFAGDITDYCYGGRGDDQVTLYFDLGGEAHGGAGTDTLVMNYISAFRSERPVDVHVVLSGPGAGATAEGQSMVLSGFERLGITTAAGDDTVVGGALDDSINVFQGSNTVQALGGDDFVGCRTGGVNSLDGGDGSDLLQLVQELAEGLILTGSAGTWTDNYGSFFSNFEFLEVYAGSGNDQVQLGSGDDFFAGRAGDDSAEGGAGRDHLFGEEGNDTLSGGQGGDVLGGGAGTDVLTGGAGADRFRFGFEAAFGDRITDFESGVDHVIITARVTEGVLAGGAVDPARFSLGSAEGSEAQFVYAASDQNGVSQLVWDANGDGEGGAALIALFDGDPVLTAGDLWLI